MKLVVMNLITKDEFHKFINWFCATPANDLVKYTIKNMCANTNVLNVLMLERGVQLLIFI